MKKKDYIALGGDGWEICYYITNLASHNLEMEIG
jgi:hypothetical protein